MAGFNDAISLDMLRCIFGDGRGATAPASWTADLYVGDPDDDVNPGTVISGNGYAAVTVTNSTANFPVDPDDPAALLLTVTFPQSTAAWPSDADHLTLSTGSGKRIVFPLAEAVTVAQGGVPVTITQPIHWNDLTDIVGVE